MPKRWRIHAPTPMLGERAPGDEDAPSELCPRHAPGQTAPAALVVGEHVVGVDDRAPAGQSEAHLGEHLEADGHREDPLPADVLEARGERFFRGWGSGVTTRNAATR